MRVFGFSTVLGTLGLLGVLAQDADPSCMEGCVVRTRDRFTEFSCVDATQAGCLCVNADFKFSVRDCSTQTCQASEEQALGYVDDTFCQGIDSPAESEAPSTSGAESTTQVPTTTEPASTTTEEAPSTTEQASSTTEQSPLTTTIAEEEASTTEEPVPSTSMSDSNDATVTTDSNDEASSTADTKPTSTSDEDQDETTGEKDDESGGLSQGAKVGIGVGVAVIVVAIAVVAAVFLLRRKRNQQLTGQSTDISRPIPPSAGRSYPSTDHAPYGEKGREGESIEMQTNRYEDMPPSETPRIMV